MSLALCFKLMFEISYGSKNRVQRICEISKSEPTLALILAAVHFEWTVKRCILKMGSSPTVGLRAKLESTFQLKGKNKDDLKTVWNDEIGGQYQRSKLGQVVGSLNDISNKALQVRGKLIHGNGTTSKSKTLEAISIFLKSSDKIYDFAQDHGADLDKRLKTRRKS